MFSFIFTLKTEKIYRRFSLSSIIVHGRFAFYKVLHWRCPTLSRPTLKKTFLTDLVRIKNDKICALFNIKEGEKKKKNSIKTESY